MDAFVGTIMLWPVSWAPAGWHFCDGTLLPVNQNQALFALIGTTYGGNGTTTFGLPDLRGRVPVGVGTGTGLSTYALAAKGGVESNILTVAELAAHTHANTVASAASAVNVSVAIPAVSSANGDAAKPLPTTVLSKIQGATLYSDATPDSTLKPFTASGTVTPAVTITNANTGSNTPVENRQPYLAVNYIICLNGLFPSRN